MEAIHLCYGIGWAHLPPIGLRRQAARQRLVPQKPTQRGEYERVRHVRTSPEPLEAHRLPDLERNDFVRWRISPSPGEAGQAQSFGHLRVSFDTSHVPAALLERARHGELRIVVAPESVAEARARLGGWKGRMLKKLKPAPEIETPYMLLGEDGGVRLVFALLKDFDAVREEQRQNLIQLFEERVVSLRALRIPDRKLRLAVDFGNTQSLVCVTSKAIADGEPLTLPLAAPCQPLGTAGTDGIFPSKIVFERLFRTAGERVEFDWRNLEVGLGAHTRAVVPGSVRSRFREGTSDVASGRVTTLDHFESCPKYALSEFSHRPTRGMYASSLDIDDLALSFELPRAHRAFLFFVALFRKLRRAAAFLPEGEDEWTGTERPCAPEVERIGVTTPLTFSRQNRNQLAIQGRLAWLLVQGAEEFEDAWSTWSEAVRRGTHNGLEPDDVVPYDLAPVVTGCFEPEAAIRFFVDKTTGADASGPKLDQVAEFVRRFGGSVARRGNAAELQARLASDQGLRLPVLVFDSGGGTTDVVGLSLELRGVNLSGKWSAVLPFEGGGDDVTRSLVAELQRRLAAELGLDASQRWRLSASVEPERLQRDVPRFRATLGGTAKFRDLSDGEWTEFVQEFRSNMHVLLSNAVEHLKSQASWNSDLRVFAHESAAWERGGRTLELPRSLGNLFRFLVQRPPAAPNERDGNLRRQRFEEAAEVLFGRFERAPARADGEPAAQRNGAARGGEDAYELPRPEAEEAEPWWMALTDEQYRRAVFTMFDYQQCYQAVMRPVVEATAKLVREHSRRTQDVGGASAVLLLSGMNTRAPFLAEWFESLTGLASHRILQLAEHFSSGKTVFEDADKLAVAHGEAIYGRTASSRRVDEEFDWRSLGLEFFEGSSAAPLPHAAGPTGEKRWYAWKDPRSALDVFAGDAPDRAPSMRWSVIRVEDPEFLHHALIELEAGADLSAQVTRVALLDSVPANEAEAAPETASVAAAFEPDPPRITHQGRAFVVREVLSATELEARFDVAYGHAGGGAPRFSDVGTTPFDEGGQ